MGVNCWGVEEKSEDRNRVDVLTEMQTETLVVVA